MKRFIFPLALAFGACTQSSTDKKGPDSISGQQAVARQTNINACYLRTEGQQQQDSVQLHLLVQDSTVTGELNWLPDEKDARRGTVLATRRGDRITGTWTYMQEGMEQKLPVEFKLEGDEVLQQPYSTDAATGTQYLDKKSDFSLIFKRVACRE